MVSCPLIENAVGPCMIEPEWWPDVIPVGDPLVEVVLCGHWQLMVTKLLRSSRLAGTVPRRARPSWSLTEEASPGQMDILSATLPADR